MFLRSIEEMLISYELMIIFLIIILVGFCLEFFIMQRKINAVKQKNEILIAQYDGVREIRHNFSNFIQALYGYVAVKDLHGIEEMCKSATKETINISDSQIILLRKLNNPALTNLIIGKCELARKNNVRLNIEIKTGFNRNFSSIYDVSKLLGILLDNAIEAASASSERLVNFKIIENKKHGKKVILIENSYDAKKLNIDKIYQKGYTTKKDVTKNHGLGLWSAQKIIELNQDIKLNTKIGEMFVQKIEINCG